MRTAVLLGALCLALILASCTAPAAPTHARRRAARSHVRPQRDQRAGRHAHAVSAPTRTSTAIRTSTPAPTLTRPPTATPTITRVPLPTPASPRPTPLSLQNSKNGLFDVVVIVDKASPDIARSDVTRVFETAASQMAAHTGEWMRLVEVVYGMSRGTTGDQFTQMQNLALAYLKAQSGQSPGRHPDL